MEPVQTVDIHAQIKRLSIPIKKEAVKSPDNFFPSVTRQTILRRARSIWNFDSPMRTEEWEVKRIMFRLGMVQSEPDLRGVLRAQGIVGRTDTNIDGIRTKIYIMPPEKIDAPDLTCKFPLTVQKRLAKMKDAFKNG